MSHIKMQLNEAIKILEANGFGAEITNKRLRKMLDDAGYSDVHLIKGDGYLYVDSDDAQHQDWLNALDSTSIYLNSFNQQSPEEWFQDIIIMLRRGRNEFIDKHPDGPIEESYRRGDPCSEWFEEEAMKRYNWSREKAIAVFNEAEYYIRKAWGYDFKTWEDCENYWDRQGFGFVADPVNEDFGIGVGGMTGADQGIPMGGDCKAVVAKRIDGGKPACRFRNMLKKRKKNKGK